MYKLKGTAIKRKLIVASNHRTIYDPEFKYEGKYHYVNKNGIIYLAPNKICKTIGIYHNSLSQNEDVDGAGEILFKKDKIIVDNFSGHFKPKKESLEIFIDIFKSRDYYYKIKPRTIKTKGIYELILMSNFITGDNN